MRNMVKVIIFVAMSLAAIGCSTSVRQVVVPDRMAEKAGLQYYWQSDVSVFLGYGESLTELKLLDEKIYCVTSANRVIAVEAATGALRWVRDIDQKIMGITHFNKMVISPKPLSMSEILDGAGPRNTVQFNAVIINTMSEVLVIDRDSKGGKVYRKMDLKFSANSGAACDGQNVYLGSTIGTFHALALAEGLPTWALSTDGMISSPLQSYGGNVYVASEDQYFYCASVGRRGKVEWKQLLEGSVTAAFYVDAGRCFVPSSDGHLYAFHPSNGTPLWEPFVCGGDLTTDVQVGDSTLFQYADGDGLYAIDTSRGTQRWHSKVGRRVLGASKDEVYVLSSDKMLMTVGEITGKVKAKIPMKHMGLFADNATAPAVYTATRSGKLYCIRSLQAGRLTAEMLGKRK